MEHVGWSAIGPRGAVRTLASSSHVVRELDRVQHDVGRGPFAEESGTADRIVLPDLTAVDHRWPGFVASARHRGVGAMAWVAVSCHRPVRVLALYWSRTGAIDDDALDLARLFAVQAAHGSGDDCARSTSPGVALLERATGVLMERHGAARSEALTVLMRSARRAGATPTAFASDLLSRRSRH